MLKRMLTALRKRSSPAVEGSTPPLSSTGGVSQGRRGFFTKAALGAVSISGTAGLAKVVVESTPEPDLSDLYRRDHLAGEQELANREYVLMSASEKEDMVQQFIDNAKG